MKKLLFNAVCAIMMAFCASFVSSCSEDNDLFTKGGADISTEEEKKEGLADVYGSDCRYTGETEKKNSLEGTTLEMGMESTMSKKLEFSYLDGTSTTKDSTFMCKNSMKVENFTSVQVQNLSDVEGKTFEIVDGAFRPGKSEMPVTIAEPSTTPVEWSFTYADGEKEVIDLCKVTLHKGTLAFGKSRRISDLVYKVAVTVTAYAEEDITSIYSDSLIVTESEKDAVVYSARFVSYGQGVVNYEWQETHTIDLDLNRDWTSAVTTLPWTMSSEVTPTSFVETGDFTTCEAKNFIYGTEAYAFEHHDVVSTANIVAAVNSLTVEPEAGKVMGFALPTDGLKVATTAVTVVSSNETENEKTTVYEVEHALMTTEGTVVLSSKAQTTGRKDISHEENVTVEDNGDGTGEIIVEYDGEIIGSITFSYGYGITVTEKKEVNPASSFILNKGSYTKGSWTGKEKYEISSNLGTLTAVKQSRSDEAAYNHYTDTKVVVKMNRSFVFVSAKSGHEYKLDIKDAETSISLVEGKLEESADKAQEIKNWTVNYKFGSAKANTAVKLFMAVKDAVTSREVIGEEFFFNGDRLFKKISVREIHKVPANTREYSFERDLNLTISNNGEIKSYEEITNAILSGNLTPRYGAQVNEGDSIVRRSVTYTRRATLGKQTAEVYVTLNEVVSYRGKSLKTASVNVNSVELGAAEYTTQDGIYSIAHHTNQWGVSVEANAFTSEQPVKIYTLSLSRDYEGYHVIDGTRTHVFHNKTANGYVVVDGIVYENDYNSNDLKVVAFCASDRQVMGEWTISRAEYNQLTAGNKLSFINIGGMKPAILTDCTDNTWKNYFGYYALQETGELKNRTKVTFSDATTSLQEFACPWEGDVVRTAEDVYSLGGSPKNFYR